MLSPARRPLFFPFLAGVLVLAFLVQTFLASRIKSPAWDETGDIAAGLSYWETGKFTVNPQHPPLVKELSGLAMLAAGIHYPDNPPARQLLQGNRYMQWPVGSYIIQQNGADRVMFWARLPFILLAAGLAIVLFLWGRRMLGGGAALGAVFLYVLDPTIVAHSYLVTLDSGLAAFSILFCFALWTYLRQPSLKRMLWCGVALGLLLAAKFSAVMLLPAAGLLIFAAVCQPPESARGARHGFWNPYRAGLQANAKAGPNDPCPCGSGKKFKKCHGAGGQALPAASGLFHKIALSVAAFLILLVIAVIVVDATYFFSDPTQYISGMRLVNADHERGYPWFLAGHLSSHFYSYFAAAYLLKEPLASIILVILGLVLVLRNHAMTRLDKLFLLLPPAILFAGHSLLADNLGIRYIIPVLPFCYLLGGVGLAKLFASAALWQRAAGAVLCVWMVAAGAGIFPDHLSYFNETACLLTNPSQIGIDGGSRCGPQWLDDSNVDWGEGLKQLKAWLDRNAPGQPFKFAYFGSYPPETYGFNFQKLEIPDLERPPTPGLYVISAHLLMRPILFAQEEGIPAPEWLRRPPKAIIGHCLYVFDLR
jgi:hypothetical protein